MFFAQRINSKEEEVKKKFIAWGILAVVLIVALLLMFAVPLITAVDVDIGVAEEGMAAETADLAIVDSEANSVIESYMVADSGNTTQIALWATLGASLSILAVVYRRRFSKLLHSVIMNLRSSGASANSEVMAGGPNKFILPAAA